MGTNYYVVDKKDLKIENRINELLKNISREDLEDKIQKLILEEYKDIINVLDEEKLESIKEKFSDELSESISKLGADLAYGINYILNVTDTRSKHIGKSSMGWLFNFQYQDEWHSYDEFKNYVLDKEKFKDKAIIDEYGEEFTPEKMLEYIDTKQNDPHNKENPDNFSYSDNVNGYRFSQGDFS